MRTYRTAIIGLLLLILMLPVSVWAQEATPPEIQVAFDALEAQTGDPITFETLTRYYWEARDFADASLGCPRPGQMYAEVITPGFQFLLTYAGTTYDYRVAEGADQAILCDSYPAPSMSTPTPPVEEPGGTCGAYVDVVEGDTLIEIADRCGTTVEALMAINPDIEGPSLIYPGQRLAIPSATGPYNVSIAPDSGPPGTSITLTASGFPPGARVQIGLGRFESEYDVIATREIGDNGVLTVDLTIPAAADTGEEWVGVVVLNRQETVSEVFQVSETALFDQTQIYLVAVGDGGRSGMEIGCGDSLVPVTVSIQPTIAPLTAALETMLAIDSRTYGQSGLYNALYRSDLTVDGIDIDNGAATIALSGQLVTGGACDTPRIEQQLQQTALQYDTIDSVAITVNGVSLTDLLSAR